MKLQQSALVKDTDFINAVNVAGRLIKSGLKPALAIWKVASEYGYETKDIAAELGGRRKKKK